MTITRSTRVPTADERRAAWSFKFYAAGHHRRERKPRLRVKPRIRIVPASNPFTGRAGRE